MNICKMPDSITDEEIAQFAEDFQFDKGNNPNSGDKVFRHAAINAKFQEFTGQIPTVSKPLKRKKSPMRSSKA